MYLSSSHSFDKIVKHHSKKILHTLQWAIISQLDKMPISIKSSISSSSAKNHLFTPNPRRFKHIFGIFLTFGISSRKKKYFRSQTKIQTIKGKIKNTCFNNNNNDHSANIFFHLQNNIFYVYYYYYTDNY